MLKPLFCRLELGVRFLVQSDHVMVEDCRRSVWEQLRLRSFTG
jgi:hypothetical protein